MYAIVKRLGDLFLSLIVLLLLTPLLVPLFLVLRFTGEGEIFYRQKRIGYLNKPFDILKFATMLKDSPNMTGGVLTTKKDPRITPMGGFLRKSKINELPQLINVLKGDMSLIGPRPLAPRGFNAYPDDVKKVVTQVPPGLSGVGSIALRNEEEILQNVSGDQIHFYDTVVMPYKGALECWYVSHRGFKLYLTLIGLTLVTVIFPQSKMLDRLFPDLPRPAKDLGV